MPALPAKSVMPVLSTVIMFSASSTLSFGVKVAVQVWSSADDTGDKAPLFIAVISSLAKPVTGSLKVIVTSEVSPILRAVSSKTMLIISGATVSEVYVSWLDAMLPFPATSVALLANTSIVTATLASSVGLTSKV